MTGNNRIFHSDLEDRWYFWDDAWEQAVGPFAEYYEAHLALTSYLEGKHGHKEDSYEKIEDENAPV